MEQPPDRIAIDANGYGWRVWDDEDYWSMVPTNPDNSPIPQPVTWFVPEEDHIEGWLAVSRAKDSMIRDLQTVLNALIADDGPCDDALRHLNPNDGCGYETYKRTWDNLRSAVLSGRSILSPDATEPPPASLESDAQMLSPLGGWRRSRG